MQAVWEHFLDTFGPMEMHISFITNYGHNFKYFETQKIQLYVIL